MIILPSQKTVELMQLEMLLPRLMRRDPNFQQLDDLYGKVSSGYYGESTLDYYINVIDLDDAFIFYGLRLPESDSYFQIDALLLTSKTCLIIEAKNFKGEISFNHAGQMIRTLEGTSEVFNDPLAQVYVQKRRLQRYIKKLGFAPLEIHPIVTFTHQKVLLNLEAHDSKAIVVNPHLPRRMEQIFQKQQQHNYSTKALAALVTHLKKNHTPKAYHVIDKYQISPLNIKKGIWCPACKEVMMERMHGNWVCPKCRKKDQNAHLTALREYAILFHQKITNKEARTFLGVQSSSATKRILHHPKIKKVGKTRDCYYMLDGLI
ncbi:Nuclease-related domain protein [Paraliobacillus sp. PM-2]|uniref:nuclease-related domain-containing protein n=1 Tax=Paraliobacillus sp. PM-2 TaxID=1462524 RepID=UPI00061C741C|nr:nuclease-related domain-containing protein [Paraliobacillus sp. PM-2]CQR46209.1 Nuclease-related domain protein [Paraliobacillus sp. PM-2]